MAPGNEYPAHTVTITASTDFGEPYHFLPYDKPFFGGLNKPAYGSKWVDVTESKTPYHDKHFLCGTKLRLGKDLRLKKLFVYCPTCMLVKEYLNTFNGWLGEKGRWKTGKKEWRAIKNY